MTNDGASCEELEPEFWTILKTPVISRRDENRIASFMFSGDGSTSSYSFTTFAATASSEFSVTVIKNGVMASPDQYCISIKARGEIRISPPPELGSTVMLHVWQ